MGRQRHSQSAVRKFPIIENCLKTQTAVVKAAVMEKPRNTWYNNSIYVTSSETKYCLQGFPV